eukprot:CAMPEP_0167776734 /NCGR_PEP_ID=MMETSP0111_2-20121227/3289_1 /TAXON_ID=91324 /ORGANISM="Lotharella globosa, Strain CCCM811" /LENGTH=42 /DNA_ID= /DNA_START= /DNA_END= /DNA_ORIENTATION=
MPRRIKGIQQLRLNHRTGIGAVSRMTAKPAVKMMADMVTKSL